MTLIYQSSNSSIIEYKLTDDIYISSNIETNCAQIYPIDYQWTIDNGSTLMKFVDENIKTTLKEIYIPSKTLTYGTYQFQLTVTIIASSNLTSSELINIKIVRPQKIIVNLIEYGLSEITFGLNQELLLEPEKYSIDTHGNKLTGKVCECFFFIKKLIFIFVFDRIGNMNIIVEFIISDYHFHQ